MSAPTDQTTAPVVLRVAFALFLAGIAAWWVAVFLQDSSVDAVVLRALLTPGPAAATLLGVLLALDVKGSASAMAARARRQRVPQVFPPKGFARFMGALLVLVGLAMLTVVLTRPVAEI